MSARAPYNFVELGEKVIERYNNNKKDLPTYERFNSKLNTGYITYELENETDLYIGDGNGNFFRNAEGILTIPGSTMRGLVRNNIEQLSFSYPEFIEDTLFLYRKFTDESKKINNEYRSIISTAQGSKAKIPDGVKVGYIYWKDNNTLVIVPAEEIGKDKRTFFRIHEKKLRQLLGEKIRNNYMYNEEIYRFTFNDKFNLKKKIKETYNIKMKKEFEKELKLEKRTQLKRYSLSIKNNKNTRYRPYRKEIWFDIDLNEPSGKITQIDTRNPKLYKGNLLNSEWVLGKTHHYIVTAIPPKDKRKEIVIDEKLVLAYEKDFAARCIQNKKLKENSSFYGLPYTEKSNKIKKLIGEKYAKPFFYKMNQDKKTILGFGPTPYFRIYYKNSLHKGIPCKKIDGLDYARAIFGFADKNEHYKSRISFSNCLIKKMSSLKGKVNIVLASPKATSFQLYLNQEGRSIKDLYNFNDANFKLRGYKFYWQKFIANPGILGKNTGIAPQIEPLKKGARFQGKIHFENLYDDELGLLFLGLQVDKDAYDNIGMGKPYGYGRIHFDNIKISLQKIDTAFLNIETEYEQVNAEKYIRAYKEYLKREGINFEEHPRIIQYLISKKYIDKEEKMQHMNFKECGKREILPTTYEIGKKVLKQYSRNNEKKTKRFKK